MITKGFLWKLAYQAGIYRISKDVYKKINDIIENELDIIIRKNVIYLNHFDKNTINITYMETSLPIYFFSDKINDKSFVDYTIEKNVLRKIKYFQKKYGYLMLSKNAFETLVKQIGKEYKENIRFTKDSILLLQYYIEYYLLKLLRESYKLTIYTKKITLSVEDINFILDVWDCKIIKSDKTQSLDYDLKKYIKLIATNIHPDFQISKELLGQFNMLSNIIINELINISNLLISGLLSKGKTYFNSKEVSTGVAILFPEKMANDFHIKGNESITLKKHLFKKLITNEKANYYLSGILEAFLSKIIQLTMDNCDYDSRMKLIPYDFGQIVLKDPELSLFFKNLGFDILGKKMLPYVPDIIIELNKHDLKEYIYDDEDEEVEEKDY